MIELENRVGAPVPLELLERIREELTPRPVEVIIVGDREIEELNRLYRGKGTPTDVLSFPVEGEFPFQPLGTIVISAEWAAREAEKRGHRLEEEIGVLFLHGLLHLLGYDHETDNGEMEELEGRLAAHFNLPNPLTGRG